MDRKKVKDHMECPIRKKPSKNGCFHTCGLTAATCAEPTWATCPRVQRSVISCPNCYPQKIFAKLFQDVRHDIFACPVCGSEFQSMKELAGAWGSIPINDRHHLKDLQGAPRLVLSGYGCPTCFELQRKFRLIHFDRFKKSYVCQTCDSTFQNKDSLLRWWSRASLTMHALYSEGLEIADAD